MYTEYRAFFPFRQTILPKSMRPECKSNRFVACLRVYVYIYIDIHKTIYFLHIHVYGYIYIYMCVYMSSYTSKYTYVDMYIRLKAVYLATKPSTGIVLKTCGSPFLRVPTIRTIVNWDAFWVSYVGKPSTYQNRLQEGQRAKGVQCNEVPADRKPTPTTAMSLSTRTLRAQST